MTNCCPEFNPSQWDEREVTWNNKLFLKDNYISLFHFPLNIGQVITKNMKMIENSSSTHIDNMMLCDEKSSWGSNIFIAIDNEIPGKNIAKISGNFIIKVFEGPYKDVPKWIKEAQSYIKSKGKDVKNIYYWYTTCPKCAKVYKKNYVALLLEV